MVKSQLFLGVGNLHTHLPPAPTQPVSFSWLVEPAGWNHVGWNLVFSEGLQTLH